MLDKVDRLCMQSLLPGGGITMFRVSYLSWIERIFVANSVCRVFQKVM